MASAQPIELDDETRAAIQRAENGDSLANYQAIFEGFEAKGIPTDDIHPRENVFTYRVWQAKGRQVQKGQKGVKVVTVREYVKGGETKRAPKTATVFHISQTEALEGGES